MTDTQARLGGLDQLPQRAPPAPDYPPHGHPPGANGNNDGAKHPDLESLRD